MNDSDFQAALRRSEAEIESLRMQLDAARADIRVKDAFIREIRSTEIEFEEALEERSFALEQAACEIARLRAFRFDIWFANGVRRALRRLRSQ